MNASLTRNDATLDLRFRYEVVDLGATGEGSVGPMRLDVRKGP